MADLKLIANDDMHAHPPIGYDLWNVDPVPVNVVLVSFPKHTAQARAFIDRMLHRGYIHTSIIDLSQVLNEGPLSEGYLQDGLRTEDSSSEFAQRCVMVNKDYPSTMRALLSTSMHRPVDASRLFVRTCGTGKKASVCCQVEREILRSLTCHNGPDCPLFAVRHYSLVGGDETDIDTLIDEMLAWLSTPERAPCLRPVVPVQTYGAVACQELPECPQNAAINVINERCRYHRRELAEMVSTIHAEPLDYRSPGTLGEPGILMHIGVTWKHRAVADVGVQSEPMIEYFEREKRSARRDDDVHRPADTMDWLNGGEVILAGESSSDEEEPNVVAIRSLSRCTSVARYVELNNGSWEPVPPLHAPVVPVQTYGAVACQELPECPQNAAINVINERCRYHRRELAEMVSTIHAEPLDYRSPGTLGEPGILMHIGVTWKHRAVADVGVQSEPMIEYFEREKRSARRDDDVHRPADTMDWLNGGEVILAGESSSDEEEPNVVAIRSLSRCTSVARYVELNNGSWEPVPPLHAPPPIRNQHDATAQRSTSVSNKQSRCPPIVAPEVNGVHRSLPTVALMPLDQYPQLPRRPPPSPRTVAIVDPPVGDIAAIAFFQPSQSSRDQPLPRPVIMRWKLVGVDPAEVAAEPVVARPPYVCCSHGDRDPTMDMWFDVLSDTFECDASSVMDFLALAQKGRRGYDKASSIIHKMFKVLNDQSGWLSSPSAFLASSVKRARHELEPEGARYGGMSSRARSVDPRGFDAEI